MNRRIASLLVRMCLLCFWLLKGSAAYAGEIVLTGVYNGKNIYIHNPINAGKSCITGIVLNGKVLPAPQSSAIDVDLSHLQMKDRVELRIIHSDDCRPKVINFTALVEKPDFQFAFSEVTAHSIEWVGKGENKESKYFVEVFRNNTWYTVATKQCTALNGNNKYSLPIVHEGNICKYRIKYYNMMTGESSYSRQMEFIPAAQKPVKKAILANKIEFTAETDYALLDNEYNVVLRGRGSIIDINNLKKGEYHLIFANQIEPLAKN
ncbi:MAG: hypothetical protein RMJ87_02855 [Cytophagales bacterium]|nr:hypothetical protein [Bernardetiaceae bacterium]MDW8203946.1 hypothetical protein [Cytophagales bacterium]